MQILKQLKRQARNRGRNGMAEVSHDFHGRPCLRINRDWIPCDGYVDLLNKANNLGFSIPYEYVNAN